MEPAILAILAGLIGSILTTVGSRICDLVQKKNEYTYALRKSFFERKLGVAEAAISQRYILSSCLKSISYLLEEISKNLPFIMTTPPEFLKTWFENVTKQLAKATDPVFDAANAVLLFFDLEELEDSALIKEAIDLIMSLNWRGVVLQILFEKHSKARDASEKEETLRTINALFDKMQSDVTNLSNKIDQGAKEVSAVIKRIRANMKQYES